MFKTALKLFSFVFILAAFLGPSKSLSFAVPPLTGPVVDQVGLLSAAQAQQLAQRLFEIKKSGQEQIQILIVDQLAGEAIESVAIQVFDRWQLGDQKKDDGVLILVAVQDRKLRIEVGQGLEGQIPDVVARRIIAEIIRPLFKTQNFFAGFSLAVEAIHQAATQPEGQVFSVEKFKQSILDAPGAENQFLSDKDRRQLADQKSAQEPSGRKKISSTFLILIFAFLWLIIFFISPSTALWILYALMSGARGGGGGMGGGGWSGGGGRSSGGGASGDW